MQFYEDIVPGGMFHSSYIRRGLSMHAFYQPRKKRFCNCLNFNKFITRHFNPHSILQKFYYPSVSKFCIVDRQSNALDVHCVCVT